MANVAIERALDLAGGTAAVAAALGMSDWGVRKWVHEGVPAKHVLWLSKRGGWRVKPHAIAPTLYPNPRDGMPPARSARVRSEAA